MESRTRLAVGGMATVAASVTVICIVALTNSVALAESAGSTIDAAPVVVPASADGESGSSGGPTATPTAMATPVPLNDPAESVDSPIAPLTSPPTAEVVPAPDAQVVTPTVPAPAPVAEQPSRPSAPASLDEAIAQAEATGSWAPVRAWAARQGWSEGRTDALVARLERAQDDDDRLEIGGDRDSGGRDDSDSERRQAPSADTDDSRDTRQRTPEERPANAGAQAEDRSAKPGLGLKKDRSHDSPEKRDR